MSKKLYIGLIAGILAGISIPVLIKFKNEKDLFSDEDMSDENDMLDKANHYLLLARNKVDEMVAEAAEMSDSILEQAGQILSSAKEKTSAIHYDMKESAEDEINKIKAEIDKSVDDFRKQIGEN